MENLTAVMKQDQNSGRPWDSRSGKQLLSLFHAESILLAAF